MAGLPINMSASGSKHVWVRCGFYVKVQGWPGGFLSALSGDTTLVDFDISTAGYFRIKMTGGGRYVAEGGWNGTEFALDLSPAMTMYANRWYWVSAGMGPFNSAGTGIGLCGRVWGPGATSDGEQQGFHALVPGQPEGTFTTHLGWGVSLSSFYQPFPNQAGYEMAELVIDSSADFAGTAENMINDVAAWPFATGDIDPTVVGPGCRSTLPLALYHCHEAVGSTSGLADSAHSYDLGPGPQGLLVVADGPY